jgi:signal transduction histidine kinase
MSVTMSKRVSPTGSAGVRGTAMGRALADAADHAAESLGPLNGPGSDDATRRELQRVCDAVCAAVDRPGKDKSVGATAFALGHIDAFRRVFLSRLAEGHPKRANGQSVVAVLRAIDTLPTRAEERAAPVESVEQQIRADALNGMLEIAHDMRSPLAAILLLVDPIRRGQYGPVTDTQERQLGLVYGAALSLSTLANDIIDAARGERALETARHPFSVSNTIHDACAVVSPIAEEKGLTLAQVYPSVDGRIGDSAAIHRVLLNLTSNALKYTERGSVTVGCSEDGSEKLEFWVKDTGRGIPSHVIEKLFDEFRPGPVGSRFYSSGLGLSICRRLVERMGGTLRVDTAPDQGTRFSFALELPVADSAPPADS